MRQRHLSFFLTITFISGLFFYSGDVSALKEETPVLKNIYVKDEEKNIQILIEGSSSLTYNILKTSDPLRIIVELPGAEAGTVKRKITIGKDPVLDISTEEQDKPFKMVRIEIGLSTSVDVIPSHQDNRLVIDIPKKSAEIPLEITKEEFQKLMETAKTRKEDKLILVIEPSQPPSEASVEVVKEEPQKPAEVPQPPSEAPVEVAKEEPQKPVEVPKEIEKESLSVTVKEEQKRNATAVTGVKVDKEKGLSVIISGDGEMRYEAFILMTDRLVIDIPDTVNRSKQVIYKVGEPPLNSVRIGQHMKPKKKVRVVLDLEKPFSYEINKMDNQLIVNLKTPPLTETKADPPQPPSEAPVEVAKEEPQKPVEVQKEIEKESLSVTAKEEQKRNATAVTGVKVDKEKGLSVIISGDGEMRYETFMLKDDRLVIDIPDTVNKSKQIIYKVGDPPLNSVRIGQHMKPKKKVRVVLDLEKPFLYEINKMDNQLIINLKTPPLTETKADPPQPPSVAPVEVAKEEPQKPVEVPQPPAESPVIPVEVAKEEPQKPVEAPQPPAETPPVAPVEVAKEEPQKLVEVPQPPAETPPVAPVEAAKEEPQKPVEAPQPPAETPPVAPV
ncbi:MAG: AMIN domain-containing protein, partial [Nitrospirota bacterium]